MSKPKQQLLVKVFAPFVSVTGILLTLHTFVLFQPKMKRNMLLASRK